MNKQNHMQGSTYTFITIQNNETQQNNLSINYDIIWFTFKVFCYFFIVFWTHAGEELGKFL